MNYGLVITIITILPLYVALLSASAYFGKVMAMRYLFRKGGMNGQEGQSKEEI